MGRNAKRVTVCFLVLVLACAHLSASAQTKPAGETATEIVFEVNRERWAHGKVSAKLLSLYKDGRVTYEEASRSGGEEKYRREKTAISRLKAQRIFELMKLAEQPDFLNSKGEYKVFAAAIDAGNRAKVIYFRKPEKQTIELTPYFSRRGETAESLPQSVKDFLGNVAKIETLMEGKLKIVQRR